jgi:hypothetical protein
MSVAQGAKRLKILRLLFAVVFFSRFLTKIACQSQKSPNQLKLNGLDLERSPLQPGMLKTGTKKKALEIVSGAFLFGSNTSHVNHLL